jgi:outer membrane biosynthesis protein TonB
MRTGATFLSAIIHAGFIAGGLFVFQAEPEAADSSTMITIPLELVTIGDVTDIAPVTKDAKIEDEAKEEEAEPAAAVAAAPPPPEPDSVVIADAEKPKKPEEKKAEVKPAPPKSNQQERSDFIDSLALGSAKPTPPKKSAAAGDNAAAAEGDDPRVVRRQQQVLAPLRAAVARAFGRSAAAGVRAARATCAGHVQHDRVGRAAGIFQASAAAIHRHHIRAQRWGHVRTTT